MRFSAPHTVHYPHTVHLPSVHCGLCAPCLCGTGELFFRANLAAAVDVPTVLFVVSGGVGTLRTVAEGARQGCAII